MTVQRKTGIAAGSVATSPSDSAAASPEVEARPVRGGRKRTRSRASTSSPGNGMDNPNHETPEAFAELLASDFSANGWKVIEDLRESKPLDYAKLCASVLPKLKKTEADRKSCREELSALSDEELLRRIDDLDRELLAIRKGKGKGTGRKSKAENGS